MENVILTMKDWLTEEIVTREISITNIFVNDTTANLDCECHTIAKNDTQIRSCLNRWIKERGNQQHDALLELISYKIA